MTGSTNITIASVIPNTIIFSGKDSEEILIIKQDGEVHYRFNGNMTKVNCPDDISEAFLYTVINYTGQQPEDIMIEKYMKKILNHSRSDEYMNKLEQVFRKHKLQKIGKFNS